MQSELARIVVVGTSGAGKTTFSQQLAQVLGVPHIELDALYWQPHWVPRPPEAFRALVEQAVAQDAWVTDGNYHVARDVVWARATTVIWLNYAFPTVFWRALIRTLRRALTHEELFAGNRESWRQAFLSRESILWWVITSFRRRRADYRRVFDQPALPHLARVEFRKPAAARRFLAALEAAVAED